MRRYPNLDAEMKARKISVRELARRIGMREQTLYAKISGRNDFKATEPKRIKEAIGAKMPLEVLFDYQPTEQKEGEGA